MEVAGNTCVNTSSCLPASTYLAFALAGRKWAHTTVKHSRDREPAGGADPPAPLSQKRPAACKIKGVLSIATVLLSGAAEGTPSGCMQDSSYGNETQIKKAKYCKNNLFY